jgi:hypothetical protein
LTAGVGFHLRGDEGFPRGEFCCVGHTTTVHTLWGQRKREPRETLEAA